MPNVKSPPKVSARGLGGGAPPTTTAPTISGPKRGTVGYTGLTPKQFASYVNRAASSEFGPQIANLQSQIGGMGRLFQTEMGQTNVGSQEFARMLAQIAPAVMKTYQNAAGYDAAYAKGFQDTLASTAPNLNPAVGQVLSTEYGLLPSQTFTEQGANMTAAAQMLPATAENLRNQALNAIGANQAKFEAGAATSLARLLGEQGKAQVTLQNQLQTQARQDYATNLSAVRAAAAIQNQQFQQGMSLAKYKTSVKEWAATYNMRVADFNRMKAVLGLDWAKYYASEKKASTVTAGEKATLYQKAMTRLQNYYYGVPGHYDITGYKTDPTTGKKVAVRTLIGGRPRLPYKAAIRVLVREFPGLGAGAIVQMVNSVYGTPKGYDAGLAQILQMGITGGAPNLGPSSNAGGFVAQGVPVQYRQHDQGRDILTRPGEAIIAPGAGRVINIGHDPGGGGAHFGPRYPIVHFTSGPYAGRNVYIGHTITTLRPGDTFTAGTVLSHTARTSGPANGGAPAGWAEIGFAPGGVPGPRGQTAPFGPTGPTGPTGWAVPTPTGLTGPGATDSPALAKQYAFNALPHYGWGNGIQQTALDKLWSRESGWNATAVNPNSGAAGIPQALGHKLPPNYMGDYRAQILWGLNYIRNRYGSPMNAWRHELAHGWY